MGLPAQAQDAAEAVLRQGDYDEARQHARELLDDALAAGDEAEAALTLYAAYLAVGDYEDGLRRVEADLREAPEDPYLLHMQGRLLAAVGRYDEALAAYGRAFEVNPEFWRNTLEAALLLVDSPQRRQGLVLLDRIYRTYRNGQFRTAPALAAAARAAAVLEEFRDANEAFRTAYQVDDTDPETLYWWAELFREKYNDADAERTYADALKLNERYADVYVGLAHTTGSFERKEQLAGQALEINPNHVGAQSLLASLRILDGLYDEAESVLQDALAVNPNSVEALAQLASVHHLRGDSAAFRQVEQRVLQQGRRQTDFYLALATNAERRFRYPDAVDFSRRAVAVDRSHAGANAQLGTALLRQGHTREARRYLEAAYERDGYNLFAANALTLLDALQNFDTRTSEHFTLLIHQNEADVLGPLILNVAEEAYDSLQARYPYRPQGKILMEAYNDAGDFGVRIAGVPHLGLLGVSFGDVVAFNTPEAQGRSDEYNWARTLWHELAHTMAIGASRFHVPRWFTEGLSVYEERRARPAWGREMDLKLLQAFSQNKLLPLAEMDRGFTRPSFPGQILLSYYHASKVIDYLVDTHGWDTVPQILQALAEKQTINAALEAATGQSVEDLDAGFRARLRQEEAQLAAVLRGLPNPFVEDDADFLDLGGAEQNALLRALTEGQRALQAEDYATAEAHFTEALRLYPDFAEPGNAYEGLAAVYRARNETDAHIDILQRFLQVTEYGAAAARELATLYEERGDLARAAAALERSLQVDPYDRTVRARLGDLYEQQGVTARAVQERRAVLALDPVDRSQAYYHLARTLHLDGQMAAAKRAVLQALEIAPGFRDAQRLLLEMVDDGS